MIPDLKAFADEAVAWMRAQSVETQAEVYLRRARDRVLSRRGGAREGFEISESHGIAVRVLRDGKAGFASAGGVDAETARTLWRRAVEQISQTDAGGGGLLPAPSCATVARAFASSLCDETLLTRSAEELEAALAQAEAAAGAEGGARVLRSEIAEEIEETVVANTRMVLAWQRGGSASLHVSASAEDGGETQVGEGFRAARRFDALDPAAAGAEAGRRARAGVGARRVRAGRRPVILEPWVAGEFLELLAGLLSAEEVQNGRSLLAGRLGATVASPLVTLRDDPRRLAGLASAAFDDEGSATRDKAMIERGVAREFFHDCATAAREGRASNGSARRGDWRVLPEPGPSNFFLAPGATPRSKLLSDTSDGLLVYEVLGAHMADPVSGEFSVGVSGYEISRGALARPFKGAMVSGNLLDLLARVDAVADDLIFYGSFGAPTFRISALDVA